MKTKDFLHRNNACKEGAKWALSTSKDMADVWEAMIKEDNSDKNQWLLWTATREGVFPEAALRKMACRFVRETPILGGCTLWDRLTDKRSRKVILTVEAYVEGKATLEELEGAAEDAYEVAMDTYAAQYAAYTASSVIPVGEYTAADAAHWVAKFALDAVAEEAILDDLYICLDIAAARIGALSTQARIVASFGNPFK